jgi:hypothetical protein
MPTILSVPALIKTNPNTEQKVQNATKSAPPHPDRMSRGSEPASPGDTDGRSTLSGSTRWAILLAGVTIAFAVLAG